LYEFTTEYVSVVLSVLRETPKKPSGKKCGETLVIREIQEGKNSSPMWERWDSNPLHGRLTRAGQVVQATVAPLAPSS
jgi:hypothetical protein